MADVIRDAISSIVESGAQFVLLGEGDPALEAAFEELGRQYPSKVAIHIGYEESLAHRLQAGADILLAPARFEPCGLTQLYASRYGTIPLVRRTGGLADTVTDATAATLFGRTATGFVFEDENLPGLLQVIDRALTLYKEPLTWRRLQLQAMARDFSWNTSATKYAALYHEAAGIPYSLLPPLAGIVPLTANCRGLRHPSGFLNGNAFFQFSLMERPMITEDAIRKRELSHLAAGRMCRGQFP